MGQRLKQADVNEIVREYYPCHSREFVLALLPGYTWNGVKSRAHALGVGRLVNRWNQPLDEAFSPECQPEGKE